MDCIFHMNCMVILGGRFPSHRGLNKNFQALKKELQKARGKGSGTGALRPMSHAAAGATSNSVRHDEDAAMDPISEERPGEEGVGDDRTWSANSQSSCRSGSGGGMRAKLYQDINAATSR
jgi:hypothetical protein